MKELQKNNAKLLIGLLLLMGVSMSADAGLFGGTSWKEEVLLHDGSKLIVKRSQNSGGRGEIGQGAPIREYSISFTLPNSGKTITWASEYSEDVGRANLHPLALHVLNGTPYIVAEPNNCLAYNKWGRPNPPYVFFKHDGKEWQRIAVQELPIEFKDINLVNVTKDDAVVNASLVTADEVKRFNSDLMSPEHKSILREAYPQAAGMCSEMIHTNEGWEGLGFFKLQSTHEACLKYCDRKGVSQQNCPCNRLF